LIKPTDVANATLRMVTLLPVASVEQRRQLTVSVTNIIQEIFRLACAKDMMMFVKFGEDSCL